MKTWLNRYSFVVVICVLGVLLWNSFRVEENCPLCTHYKCHAPCILNLGTGEMAELELFQPHATKVGEIAEEQSGGTFSFVRIVGLQGIRLTDPWYAEIYIPIQGERKNNFFCNKCESLLSDFNSGYVLVDMYDPENPHIYSIEEGVIYKIRCYKVEINMDSKKEMLCLRSTGELE